MPTENRSTKNSIPPVIGESPLGGSYYAAECPRCGWVGSSEELTDDCQCTQPDGEHVCLGHTDEIGPERLLGIVQAMAKQTQYQGEPVAYVLFRNGGPDYDCDGAIISNVRGDTLGHGDSWEPVYARPDIGEVERLQKGHIKALEALNQQSEKQRDHWIAECEGLRKQLRLITGDYRTAIVNGHERITFLGGDCDSVEKMLDDNPNYAQARALLARKP